MTSTRRLSHRRPRLILICEGEAEVGHKPAAGRRDHRRGVLPQLLQTAIAGKPEAPGGPLSFKVLDAQTLRDLRVHRAPKGKVFQRKMGLALHKVDELSADGIAFLVDRETPRRGDPRPKISAEVARFRAEFGRPFAAVIGAACRCLETWLLADREARRTAFGAAGPDPFSVSPEERPPARELKAFLRGRCKAEHLSEPEARRILASHARPTELARRCPKSYRPFLQDVKSELKPLCS